MKTLLCFIFAMSVLLPTQALADFGPKPSYNLDIELIEDRPNPYTPKDTFLSSFWLSSTFFIQGCSDASCSLVTGGLKWLCGNEEKMKTLIEIPSDCVIGGKQESRCIGVNRIIRHCRFSNVFSSVSENGNSAWLKDGNYFRVKLLKRDRKGNVSNEILSRPIKYNGTINAAEKGSKYIVEADLKNDQVTIKKANDKNNVWDFFSN